MKIGIAIVHYGDDALLENCLKSLEQKPSCCFSAVFNCNEENIGFSAGNNRLIKDFLKCIDVPYDNGGAEWIWLLNNDTTVPQETLDKLKEILLKVPEDVGILGFQIRSMDDPDFIHHAGTFQSYPAGVHKTGSVRLKQHNKVTYEKWVTFASVLVRREVFESIGLLDEQMFNYYSDSDFCFRARYSGWKIQYIPELVVLHKIGSSQNPSPAQLNMIRHDQLVFENKWMNGKTFFDLEQEVL